MAEQEANHNGSVFMNRTNETWHYYSTMFDLLENSEWTKRNTLALEIAEQVQPGSPGFKYVQTRNLLLALITNEEGYRVEVKDGRLMLSWHSRPLITTSAWRLLCSCPDHLPHLAESLNNARTMIYPLRRRDASSHIAMVLEKEHKRLLTQKSIIEKRKEEH
ncbi:hypothetical protein H5410_053138 [Solanum commersonii]|uniref:Uncharacterized protein n=1 Tax=Solanum commersonii TaxID=4109 RepID=A0A9J5X437_SOLCO|nr:hypothetical protein H5410_053138 [Solanum commersonii]